MENPEGSLDVEKKYVGMRIAQCNNGKKNVRDSIPIIMLNMGPEINSRYPDYTAAVSSTEDMIVFTSRRAGSTGGAIDLDSPFEREDIYYSTKNEDGTWNTAKKIKGDVNSGDHDAVVWLSPKGDKLIIYRYNKNDNGDLYESEFKNDSWTAPEPMKMINSKFRETHACYSPDGNTIYYTTANPKYANKGGIDICLVAKDANGKWSEPKGIDEINTIYNEESPFIKSDGKTFYFSSQGHTSIGGFDIFKCEIDAGKFTTPKNVGFPINSTSNDVFIFFTEDGKKAFFDSDRKGGQGERIYSVEGKSVCLSALSGGRGGKTGLYEIKGCAIRGRYKNNSNETEQTLEIREDEKTNCLTSVSKDSLVAVKDMVRKLTPIECERLQGYPDSYSECVSNSQRYKALGNSFTVPVIKHILKNIL